MLSLSTVASSPHTTIRFHCGLTRKVNSCKALSTNDHFKSKKINLFNLKADRFSHPNFPSRCASLIHERNRSRKGSETNRVSALLSSEEAFEREEFRWQREEKRWLREEERWERERSQWQEKEAILKMQIDQLKSILLEISKSHPELLNTLKFYDTLYTPSSTPNGFLKADVYPQLIESSISDISQSVNRVNTLLTNTLPSIEPEPVGSETVKLPSPPSQIHTAVSSSPYSSKSPLEVEEKAKSIVSVDSSPSSLPVIVNDKVLKSNSQTKRTLKKGAEGDVVKQLQDALSALGFYCGEEEIEFSFFAEGTESAVKTWQASIGIKEDGVITESLFSILISQDSSTPSTTSSDSSPSQSLASNNSTSSPSYESSNLDTSKTKLPMNHKDGGLDVPERLVYLLGENRWEDSSRLIKNLNSDDSKANRLKMLIRCHVCSGIGAVSCLECDGTGEMNIEEQFIDWIDENAKCVYCEGTGLLLCDSCEGNGKRI